MSMDFRSKYAPLQQWIEEYYAAVIDAASKQSWYLVLVGSIAFVVGAHCGGANLISTLDRWQTLIAGILAVIAAAATIGRMVRTDERQDTRHREQIALQMRASALKFDRAVNPYAIGIGFAATRVLGAVEIARLHLPALTLGMPNAQVLISTES